MDGSGLITRQLLPEHGEFRAFVRPERDGELSIEVLREEDGRAFILRVPRTGQAGFGRLVERVAKLLTTDLRLDFGEDGACELDKSQIDADDEIASVVLAEGEGRAFAFWRRERLQAGWSWTIDVVLVPLEQAPDLCRLTMAALREA